MTSITLRKLINIGPIETYQISMENRLVVKVTQYFNTHPSSTDHIQPNKNTKSWKTYYDTKNDILSLEKGGKTLQWYKYKLKPIEEMIVEGDEVIIECYCKTSGRTKEILRRTWETSHPTKHNLIMTTQNYTKFLEYLCLNF